MSTDAFSQSEDDSAAFLSAFRTEIRSFGFKVKMSKMLR